MADSAAWAKLLTYHALAVAEIERRLAAADLPPLAWYDALWALERSEGGRLRISEFERWMVISRSNITRLVDRLEAAGHVRREAAADDGRGAYAVLTTSGRRLRARMWTVYGPAIDELFNRPLDGDEQAQFDHALAKLLSALRTRG
jgi:DNA-binding MarR family transcriptional regulator